MAINVSLTNLANLQNETTAVTAINANNAAITTALLDAVAIDGTIPNQIQANLDLNNQQILNLPPPATANSPLRLQDLSTFVGSGTVTSMPAGGTTGQILTKTSNANYAANWQTGQTGVVTSVGLSLPSDFVVTNSPVVSSGTLTGAWGTTPTGTGAVVRATSPTLVSPVLGTPASGVATNLTGTAAGLTAGTVTTNANLTGPITSVGNATTIAANAITNAGLATMAANTVKGNATGSTATPTDVAPASARSSSLLNIDSFTGHGDSIYTILTTDRTVGTNAAFTASRIWTLPAANAVNPGQEIIVADFQGTVTGVNTLIVSRAGSDTINGGTSITIIAANGAYMFKSDGISKWSAQALGPAAAGGVSSITAGTGLSGGNITTSGTIAIIAGQVPGEPSTGNASAGNAGEYISSTVAATTVSLTNVTATNATSISLTAGDWDVSGNVSYIGNAATTVLYTNSSISTTTSTQGIFNTFYAGNVTYFGSVSGGGFSSVAPTTRVSISSTTTVYLIGFANFATNTMTCGGTIRARRIR